MASIRYLSGLYAGKAANTGIRMLRRAGGYYPGVISQKLDPKYLSHMAKPKRIIAVTGTNGKTTTSNLILDILRRKGEKPANNSLGSNTIYGILTSLSQNLDALGRKKSEIAVLEVDEQYTPHIFRDAPPEILAVTNIYQDSYKRNAHTDFIRDIIARSFPKGTKLVLNGDDLISSTMGPDNPRVLFGIDRLPGEAEQKSSRLKDLVYCPVCGEKLVWDFVRYHHMGRAHCDACGFKNGEIKYRVVDCDFDQMEFTLLEGDAQYKVPLSLRSVEGIYNQLTAFSVLREFGMEPDEIITAMRGLRVVESRFNSMEKNGKRICLIAAKGINPIANSRVIDAIRNSTGKKTVIIMNDNSVRRIYSEMFSWIYDTDFECLNNEDLNKLIFASWKCQDFKVRCLLGGFPEDKLIAIPDHRETADYVDANAWEDVYILHDIEGLSIERAAKVRDEIFARMETVQ